jgi:hypothetical protein
VRQFSAGSPPARAAPENFIRKTFAPSEIVAIATALLKDERQAARDRQGTSPHLATPA